MRLRPVKEPPREILLRTLEIGSFQIDSSANRHLLSEQFESLLQLLVYNSSDRHDRGVHSQNAGKQLSNLYELLVAFNQLHF